MHIDARARLEEAEAALNDIADKMADMNGSLDNVKTS